MEQPAAITGGIAGPPPAHPMPRVVLVHCNRWICCSAVRVNSIMVVEHHKMCGGRTEPANGNPWRCRYGPPKCCDNYSDMSPVLPPPLPPRNRPSARPPVPPRTQPFRPPIPPRRGLPLPLPPPSATGNIHFVARESNATVAPDNNQAAAGAPENQKPACAPLAQMYDSWNAQPDLSRVVLFSNAQNLLALKRNRFWFSEGMVSGPDGFGRSYYVYNVRAVEEGSQDTELVVRAYMTERTAETYERMFRAIKSLLPDKETAGVSRHHLLGRFRTEDPHMLVIHLSSAEKGVIKGVRSVFRNIRVKACLAHTARSIWNMAVKCGVPREILDTAVYRRQLERLMVLIFVAPKELPRWYRTATDSDIFRERATELAPFLEQFRATYVGWERVSGPEFPVEVWNVHNDIVAEWSSFPDLVYDYTTPIGLPRFVKDCKRSELLWCMDEEETIL